MNTKSLGLKRCWINLNLTLGIFAILAIPTGAYAAVGDTCGETPVNICIMLDRTGSVSATERTNEANAARGLIDTIAARNNGTRVAIGRFGDNTNGGLEAEIFNTTTVVTPANATTIKNAITTGLNASSSVGTNVADGINVCQTELRTTHPDPNHNKNIIIMISDFDPSEPTGGTDNAVADAAAVTAATTAKTNGIRIFTIGFDVSAEDAADEKNRALGASLASGSALDDKCTATNCDHTAPVDEIAQENADGDDWFLSPTATELNGVFSSIFSVVLCADDGNACTVESCNANSDKCESAPISNCQSCQTAANCGDGNTCTTDTCVSGRCVYTTAGNGTACNDNNLCTNGEVCTAGVCGTPASMVICSSLDECHIVGQCNPATGLCSNPNKLDGSPCSDDDSCSSGENCVAGLCVPGQPIDCDDNNECTADSCDSATDECGHDPVTPGTGCDDGDICTVEGKCGTGDQEGECVSTTKNCDDNNVCTDDTCDSDTSNCTPSEDPNCGCVHNANDESVDCYTGPAGTKDVGICHGGTEQCSDGSLGDCEDEVTPGTDNNCDGIDDDCDGVADDDYVESETNCGVGECGAKGRKTCENGHEVDSCTPGRPTSDANCDGKDNDCDGSKDEDYVPTETNCGVGECADKGQNVCENGVIRNTCEAGTPAADDSLCDGKDNDCDGHTDEDYLPTDTQCGVGQCAATGKNICEAGVVKDTCTVGTPAPDDTACDGKDNDCDGSIDEDYVPTDTSCGVGECAAKGKNVCEGGAVKDTCSAGTPTSDANCDGKDNDCDGHTDEDYVPTDTQCGVGECAATGQNVCEAGVIKDTCSAGAPTSDANCDGKDNDCDNSTDEDYVPTDTSCGVGECAAKGQNVCENGSVKDTCSPGAPAADDTSCDGKDNDCDGSKDEDYLPTDTDCGVGQCAAKGQKVCESGVIRDTCDAGEPALNDPTCDGKDDDCDGTNDEDYQESNTICGEGVCAASGELICQGGSVVDTCKPNTPISETDATCDGFDDDCDGSTDEDYQPTDTECGTGECHSVGQMICQEGEESDTCTPLESSAELCDKLDNDCDEQVDEDFDVGDNCTVGVGACEMDGHLVCSEDGLGTECDATPGAPSSDANCDGIDDDCDGVADDDYVETETSCGTGECAAKGEMICENGKVRDTCEAGAPAPSDANCDGKDNDCDGSTDEDYVETDTSCGVGECAAKGQKICEAGEEKDTCSPGSPAANDALCDGKDNDCDGHTDEDYVPTDTQCGVGECAAKGQNICEAGVIKDTCQEGTPAANDALCDGKDNDCDGQTDEEYEPTPTSCGIGECAAKGENVCENGAVKDTCQEGTPAADDASCDGKDNDCDGSIDEDYTETPTECGVGACAADGHTTCEAGVIGDTCKQGTPAEIDNDCDNVDDDCDGKTDEDYVESPTECGVGACAADGHTTCEAGVIGNTCKEGTPAEIDNDCDNVDDDCDGKTDEDYVESPTECGVGACAADGHTTCEAGLIGNTCKEGTPAEIDNDCDNVDDDCDGKTDEDYVETPTECGVGACAADGHTTCEAGVIGNTCKEGTPAEIDNDCDNVDDDCDGKTDEDYVETPTECGVGACAADGHTTCEAGVIGNTCKEGTPAETDNDCDNVDDDCDGNTDEDYVETPTSCGVGACAAEGHTTCDDGEIGDTCKEGTPAEIDNDCDNVDDDCDGKTDEDYVETPTECGVGACAAEGHTTCEAGVIGNTCKEGTPAEIDNDCDNVDDDCDGKTDEDYVETPTECGVGACAADGHTTCEAGVIGNTCKEGTPAADDSSCDGKDNDCNGSIDEDYVETETSCGVGECAAKGQKICEAGEEKDTCSAGSPAEDDASCDGKDNDCNGSIDEDYVETPTECGVGACAGDGHTTCSAGVVGNTCQAGEPSTEVCDGIDNNCDGNTDEGLNQTVTCGVGVCQHSVNTCTLGRGASCDPQEGSAEEICNGIDDDCDGQTDEGLGQTSCGQGECEHTVDNCVEGEPQTCDANEGSSSESCDGLDNDCDGVIDNGGSALCNDNNGCTIDVCNDETNECENTAIGDCGVSQHSTCGDGAVGEGEECDGENDSNCGGRGCNSDCQCNPEQQPEPTPSEQPDDSGQVPSGPGSTGLQVRGDGCGSSGVLAPVEIPVTASLPGPTLIALGLTVTYLIRRRTRKHEGVVEKK